jgi:hypothetical protein
MLAALIARGSRLKRRQRISEWIDSIRGTKSDGSSNRSLNEMNLGMAEDRALHLTVFHLLEGLRKGLSRFSRKPSRSALILGLAPDKPLKVYDYQNLLADHRGDIGKYYESNQWNKFVWTQDKPQRDLGRMLDDAVDAPTLNSFGSLSTTPHYQMWFTERHPLVACHGPTVRWLQRADSVLTSDRVWKGTASENPETLGQSLEWYAPRAINHHLNIEFHDKFGRDPRLRVSDVLDAVAGISTTYEEERLATGGIVFSDDEHADQLRFVARFPLTASPSLNNWKHITKLLLAVESTGCALVSDGSRLLGICDCPHPAAAILTEFRRGTGHLYWVGSPLCTISGGRCYSAITGPDWAVLDRALTEIGMQENERERVRGILIEIAQSANEKGHGCTLLVDADAENRRFAGQKLESPLQVSNSLGIEMAKSMAQIDGALLIDTAGRLHAFGCILDGNSTASEDRSRGARFNSALRFCISNAKVVLLVVSENGQVSMFHSGKHLTEAPSYPSVDRVISDPPTLQQWLRA